MTTSSEQFINERQNDDDHLRLLKAADVEHGRAQRSELGRWIAAAILSSAALAATIFPDAQNIAAIIGIVATLLTEIVWPWFTKRRNSRAVLIQEGLDTSLFGIPWNSELGEQVPLAHIALAASRYSTDDSRKRDWYLNVRGIPSPLAETLCQRQNLLWDADQRQAWAWRLAFFLAAWLTLGLLISLVGQWYVWQLFVWYIAPTLSIATLLTHSLVQQHGVSKEKTDLRRKIDSVLDGLTPATITVDQLQRLSDGLRPRQDKIFNLRLESARVPEAFYNRLRVDNEAIHEVEAAHYRRIWEESQV